MRAEKRHQKLAAPGAHQTGDSENFASANRKADVFDDVLPAVFRVRSGYFFDFERDCAAFVPHWAQDARACRIESVQNANDMAKVAALAVAGRPQPYRAVPWFWSDQYDLTLQIAGLAEGAVTHLRREIGEGSFIVFHLDADGRLLAASGVGPGNSVARDIRLAEMLIAARACPDPAALVAPDVKLKSLLAA